MKALEFSAGVGGELTWDAFLESPKAEILLRGVRSFVGNKNLLDSLDFITGVRNFADPTLVAQVYRGRVDADSRYYQKVALKKIQASETALGDREFGIMLDETGTAPRGEHDANYESPEEVPQGTRSTALDPQLEDIAAEVGDDTDAASELKEAVTADRKERIRIARQVLPALGYMEKLRADGVNIAATPLGRLVSAADPLRTAINITNLVNNPLDNPEWVKEVKKTPLTDELKDAFRKVGLIDNAAEELEILQNAMEVKEKMATRKETIDSLFRDMVQTRISLTEQMKPLSTELLTLNDFIRRGNLEGEIVLDKPIRELLTPFEIPGEGPQSSTS